MQVCFNVTLINITSILMNLIVAKLLSEHDTQSDGAQHTAKRPPKQNVTARCSTPPAATTTVPITATAAAAAAAVTSTIIHSPFLRPHLPTIARSIPSCSRHTDIELIAHLVKKPNKHCPVVS
jgi:hypothetical protein